MRPTGLEERWVGVIVGSEGGVSENASVEREGNVGVVFLFVEVLGEG